jgi:hypothetical protein
MRAGWLAIHQPQLHSDLRLDIGPQLNHMVLLGFLRLHDSRARRWLVVGIHRIPRTRGVMFPGIRIPVKN